MHPISQIEPLERKNLRQSAGIDTLTEYVGTHLKWSINGQLPSRARSIPASMPAMLL